MVIFVSFVNGVKANTCISAVRRQLLQNTNDA